MPHSDCTVFLRLKKKNGIFFLTCYWELAIGVSGQNLIPVVFSFVFQTCDCAFELALLFVSLPKMHSAAWFKDQESGFIKPDVKFSC